MITLWVKGHRGQWTWNLQGLRLYSFAKNKRALIFFLNFTCEVAVNSFYLLSLISLVNSLLVSWKPCIQYTGTSSIFSDIDYNRFIFVVHFASSCCRILWKDAWHVSRVPHPSSTNLLHQSPSQLVASLYQSERHCQRTFRESWRKLRNRWEYRRFIELRGFFYCIVKNLYYGLLLYVLLFALPKRM